MDLRAAINLAREEAIRTRGVAALCPRAADRAGEPYCSGTGDWSHGWLVLTLPSTGSVTTCPTTSNTNVVRAFDPPDSTARQIAITASSVQKSCLRFGATGLPASNFAGLTFTVAFPGDGKVSCLVLSSAGRLRREDKTGTSCNG
ncbi:GspH/FimT family protein [Derxia lacustris]|uniref:GspH/FimT family protein n=1 Tax=Derxia lacustris TaxID=764842 RepID=UPI001F22B932|nr:GspH/FimT family protein [Derxia lacustris]